MMEKETIPSNRIKVVCRPARESDTKGVLELTRLIWDGGDYIPSIWKEWLQDKEGRLTVAEWEGRVIGLGKLTRLSPEDWWLEGLRTHPDFEGRGIATQVFYDLLAAWNNEERGKIRLATSSGVSTTLSLMSITPTPSAISGRKSLRSSSSP